MKWFLDLTMRGKLFVCFGLIFALFAGVIVTAYTGIATILESQDRLYKENFANVRDLMALRANYNGMRALMLEYQDDPETFNLNSEFMFGKEFLVAPVVEKEAILKKIYLPEGEWIDFNHPQKSFQGKQWIDYPVLLSTIPVFVKRGSVIPQMPVLQYIGEKKNAPVWFEVFPATEGRSATFSLYEDDGETNNYKNDLCNKTEVKCVSANDGWEISVQHRKNEWKPEQARNLGIKIHLEQAPKTVVFNSGKLKQTNHEKLEKGWYDTSENLVWSWDKLTNTCWVKWRDNESPAEITIKK